MLRLLSNLNLCTRFDAVGEAGLLVSGVTGSWVTKTSATEIDFPAAKAYAIGPIWTESNRDGSGTGAGRWSPDVAANGNNLTILMGNHRALTDQYTGTPAVGARLEVAANGTLAVTTGGYAVAYVTKAQHSITHLGSATNVIEYVSI